MYLCIQPVKEINIVYYNDIILCGDLVEQLTKLTKKVSSFVRNVNFSGLIILCWLTQCVGLLENPRLAHAGSFAYVGGYTCYRAQYAQAQG